MEKTDKYFFENVIPHKKKIDSTKIEFKDSNDIYFEQKKNNLVFFCQNINKIVLTIIFSFFFIIFIKLFNIFFISENYLLKKKIISQDRGKIFDRNGELLATNIDTKDFYIDTRKILEKERIKSKLKQIFPKKNLFFERVFSKNNYIKVKSHLTPYEINQLKLLGDPSIKFHNSTKRVYLQQNLFSHITGFKTEELKSKIEKNLDEELKEGSDVELTLDLRVQDKVHEELSKSLKLYNANSAIAIVMNVNNGDIISLVSLPDFNPNYPEDIKAFSENNLAFEARYEMGSTLKIFNAALVFENNPELANKKFAIKKGYQITPEKLIKDEHITKKNITFEEIFTESSNVGSIKLIDQIGIKKQRELFEKLNFNNRIQLHGLNVVKNQFPKNWDSQASRFISYGYGISISPISLITAYASLVNGGLRINPRINLKKEIENKRIFKNETSQQINSLLNEIVKKGTGKKANVSGVAVGGKTGTSKKLENGKYSEKKVITSFIGTFPIDNPKYLTFVLFDEPRRNTSESLENFGGNTAAPTFSRIIRKISPILNKNNYLNFD